MKKTYIIPGMIMVRLQHQRLLMQSVNNVSGGDTGMKFGGGGINNTSGSVRTKESSSIWDEEW